MRNTIVIFVTLLIAGCSGSSATPDAGPVDAGNADAGLYADGGCIEPGRAMPDEGHSHAPSEPDGGYFYVSQPPSSGNHYPVPAGWGIYTRPVAREQYVHSEEHGGVVLVYNCPTGCSDIVDGLTNLYGTAPLDPTFGEIKVVVTPDPDYDGGQVAAAAWGYVYTPTTLDMAGFRCFIALHEGHGPEQVP